MKDFDFSIEEQARRIPNARTREYFEEVYSNYANGAYRSAMVMLWSVVVIDMLYKLQELEQLYGDETAKAILEEVRSFQAKNPRSPDWELQLLDTMHKRTFLLEPAEHESLVSLQRKRHLSAHPVLDSNLSLSSPHRDAVRAAIRDALASVLTKPAVMSRKVFDLLVEDLEEKQDVLVLDEDIERYLEGKFLKNLPRSAEASIFKRLWKIVFKVDDDRCNRNRGINYRALRIMLVRSREMLCQEIKSAPDYFSDFSTKRRQFRYLVRLLSEHGNVFDLLTEAGRTLLQSAVEDDDHYYPLAWFISGSLLNHLTILINMEDDEANLAYRLSKSVFARLVALAKPQDLEQTVYQIGVGYYSRSSLFDSADERFSQVIRPYLRDWDQTTFVSCFRAIEGNDQTYARGRAKRDHAELLRVFRELFPEGTDALKEFPQFLKSAGDE